jgi:hypothetical protein
MALFSNRPGSRDDSSSERGKKKKKKIHASNGGRTFLERYALWSHRNPLLALTCIVLVAVACILTVVLNDELQFVETNDREWVILKDEITSDADAASEGTRLVEECVLLLDSFSFCFCDILRRPFVNEHLRSRGTAAAIFLFRKTVSATSRFFSSSRPRSRERERERRWEMISSMLPFRSFYSFPNVFGKFAGRPIFSFRRAGDAFRKGKNFGGD